MLNHMRQTRTVVQHPASTARLRVARATVQTLNVKICSLPFFVLAILAYAELMYSNQMGNNVISAHRIDRKLTSSHSGDFELVDISSTISIDWKFRGAATASDGKIIFAPCNAESVGVFDPSDNSFELVDISSTISHDSKFSGASLQRSKYKRECQLDDFSFFLSLVCRAEGRQHNVLGYELLWEVGR